MFIKVDSFGKIEAAIISEGLGQIPEGFIEVNEDVKDISKSYFDGFFIRSIPESPGKFHNWSWENKIYILDIETLRNELLRLTKYLNGFRIINKVTFDNTVFDASDSSISNIRLAIENIDTTINWRSADNTFLELDKQQLKNLLKTIFEYRQEVLTNLWIKVDQIRNETDPSILLNKYNEISKFEENLISVMPL